MIDSLLSDLARRGIELSAAGGTLRYRPVEAMTPELLAKLRAHRAELLGRLLFAAEGFPIQRVSSEGPETEWDAPLIPCPKCRGLMTWWDLTGGEHCLDCDPPSKSRTLMDQRARILTREKALGKRRSQ